MDARPGARVSILFRYFLGPLLCGDPPASAARREVLSARYVHDLRYFHYGKPITVLPLMRWLVCVLFPRPHIVFFLFDDPKRIHARKAQLEEDAIRQNQEIYRKALFGLYVVEVKTDRDVEDIATEIVRVAVERYFARR